MNGTSNKDPQTGGVSVDKGTGIVGMLEKCNDFKNKQTQLKYILTSLRVNLRLTPK